MSSNYKQLDVTVAAGAEGQSEIIQSTVAEPKRIIAIRTDQNNVSIDYLANIGRTRITDIPTPETQDAPGWLEIHQDLAIGESLSLGFRNGTGGAITGQVVVWYEIRPSA